MVDHNINIDNDMDEARDILMFPLGPCWSCCPAPPPVHLWPGLARGHLAQLGSLGHVEMSDYKVASQCPSARCQPSSLTLTLTWPPAAHLLSWRELS